MGTLRVGNPENAQNVTVTAGLMWAPWQEIELANSDSILLLPPFKSSNSRIAYRNVTRYTNGKQDRKTLTTFAMLEFFP